jgi:hypothetical protein
MTPGANVSKFEQLFRLASGLDMDKNKLKRLDGFISRKLYGLLRDHGGALPFSSIHMSWQSVLSSGHFPASRTGIARSSLPMYLLFLIIPCWHMSCFICLATHP